MRELSRSFCLSGLLDKKKAVLQCKNFLNSCGKCSRRMKTSLLCFRCVLIICFLTSPVNCYATEKEAVKTTAAQCLDIDLQVKKLNEDILTVTEKKNDYHITYDFSTPGDDPTSNEQAHQRYPIGLHLSSLKLHLTLKVVDKCKTENWNRMKGRGRKLFTSRNSVEVSLEYSSSSPASATQRMASAMLDWIMWPFKSLKNISVSTYKLLVDKAVKGLQWIAQPLKKLKEKIAGGIYSYLKPKIDNPIIVIEAVLEVIWKAVKPVLQAGQWLYEFMAAIIKQAKVKAAEVLKKYPVVPYYLKNCQILGGHVLSVLAQWPLSWQEFIEYIGFSWVIIYFMFNLFKLSAMDERKLHRTARNQDNIHSPSKKTGTKAKLV